MNSERKITRLQKKLNRCAEKYAELETEKLVLAAENTHLKKELESANHSVEELRTELVSSREDYAKCLSDLAALKNDYQNLRNSMLLLKKQYKKKMDSFIKNVLTHS